MKVLLLVMQYVHESHAVQQLVSNTTPPNMDDCEIIGYEEYTILI